MARTRRVCRDLLVAVATLLGIGALGPTAAAAAATPTVTFHADQNGNCGTVPSVGGLTVPEGTPVQFLNRTGRDATLTVGGQDEPVPRNAALQLTIAVGQYEVRLVDNCGSFIVSQPVVVTVTGAESTATTPSTTPATTSAPAPTVPGSGASPVGRQEGVDAPTSGPRTDSSSAPAVVPAADASAADASATASGPSRTGGPSTGSDLTPVLAATLLGPDDAGSNPKDVRLLAVVAAICVLGVTAAIIRSIVRLSP